MVSHISKRTVVVVSLNRILIDEQSAGTRPCGDTSQDVPLDRYRIQETTLAHVVAKHPTYACVYLTPTASALLASSAVRARDTLSAETHHVAQLERKEDREREIERERSKHLDYAYVRTKYLLQAHRSQ